MVILNQERGTGKTCTLIKLSSRNNIPIATPFNTKYIKNKAKELNLQIPEPIAIHNLNDLNGVGKVYIDDMDILIQNMFPCDTQLITMSVGDKIENLF
ncbi:MAG: hypothetical protein NC244_07695 [Alistipes senegalensis]|nr:hypothetical protein [Alistipes senegalensis]